MVEVRDKLVNPRLEVKFMGWVSQQAFLQSIPIHSLTHHSFISQIVIVLGPENKTATIPDVNNVIYIILLVNHILTSCFQRAAGDQCHKDRKGGQQASWEREFCEGDV